MLALGSYTCSFKHRQISSDQQADLSLILCFGIIFVPTRVHHRFHCVFCHPFSGYQIRHFPTCEGVCFVKIFTLKGKKKKYLKCCAQWAT